MYLYVSEIFPTEIRPIGMGFSLFGQFACELSPNTISIRLSALTFVSSNNHPPPNSPNRLRPGWLEVLPRHYHLVCILHSK